MEGHALTKKKLREFFGKSHALVHPLYKICKIGFKIDIRLTGIASGATGTLLLITVLFSVYSGNRIWIYARVHQRIIVDLLIVDVYTGTCNL